MNLEAFTAKVITAIAIYLDDAKYQKNKHQNPALPRKRGKAGSI
ncbi:MULTISPECIES: hypothetical protein [unclassified Coleofasciculus]|nr:MULTISPECIES: hypothetical protein [unclassified Coleofasciculus]